VLAAPPRSYVAPRLSPDGTRLAVNIQDQDSDFWIWDFSRQKLTRLTFGPTGSFLVWTPDARRVIFTLARDRLNLYRRTVDGTGIEEQLTVVIVNSEWMRCLLTVRASCLRNSLPRETTN
jgi:Tol biopolymer transport system component